MKLSANLGFLWPDRPLLQRIAAAGRAGFPAVEMHWPYDVPAEDLAAACRAAGVQLIGLNTAVGQAGEFGLGALPGRERDFQRAIDQSLAYCAATGARAIHAMAGVVEDGPDSTSVFIANLGCAAEKAAKAGVSLLLEPINPRDRPGYFYSTIERAAELIAAIGAPNVRIMFDVYHVAVAQGDVLTRFDRHLPLIGHVQIAAVPSRAEPDEGEIDYAAVLAHIGRSAYDGWIGCEYRPRGDTDSGLDWIRKFGLSL